ncbi:hypothetical protein TrRE_jg2901 [Triparma retinervis]|uniref:Uncharacterized protein n=1 Tax=Triparma retinervis TaxID=2557542 RepID=A0A9W7AH92_9STRA|nr:hypothetical protein TrRE_jg2901 [Triparma retinervis]
MKRRGIDNRFISIVRSDVDCTFSLLGVKVISNKSRFYSQNKQNNLKDDDNFQAHANSATVWLRITAWSPDKTKIS